MLSKKRTQFSQETQAARRKNYIRKSRFYKTLSSQPLTTVNFGKMNVTTRLAKLVSYQYNTLGSASTLNLTTYLQTCDDWTNYAGTYAMYNVHSVSVKFIPGQFTPPAQPNIQMGILGSCYDPISSTALTAVTQVLPYQNYMMHAINGFNSDTPKFKFKIKPTALPPWSTASATNNIGYLKSFIYSSVVFTEGKELGAFLITWRVSFGSIE